MQPGEPRQALVGKTVSRIEEEEGVKRPWERKIDPGDDPHHNKEKKTPESTHTTIKKKHQNPSPLCRSQLIRAKCALQVTVRLRRQCLIPGHHMTAPVTQREVTQIAPMPFTRRPADPDSRFS